MNEINNQTPSCIPLKKFTRNEYGLICDESIKYYYKVDGTIDWRKMIKPEYLVPNKDNFEQKGLPIPESTDGLDDKDVLILLAGLKDLARTRGYSDLTFVLTTPHEYHTSSVCRIIWLPNYETGNQAVSSSSTADANDRNTTTKIAKNFLATTAENRSFCRAVRNFLGINIVAQEEMNGKAPVENYGSETDSALKLLRETVAQYNIPFAKIKKKLMTDKIEGAENFESLSDIPRAVKFDLVTHIKKKAAAKEAEEQKETLDSSAATRT